MSIDIPPELQWVSYLAGSKWPQGDEDGLWRIGEHWKASTAEMSDLIPDLNRVRSRTMSVITGETAAAVEQEFALLFDGDFSMDKLVEAMSAVGELARAAGTQIEASKIEILIGLSMGAAELLYAIAMAPWTFGSSLAWIPVIELLTMAVIRMLFTQLMQALVRRAIQALSKTAVARLLREVAQQSAQEVAEELIINLSIQQYQVDKGRKDEIDWKDVGTAAKGAAAGGAAGGAFHGPAFGALGGKHGGGGIGNAFAGAGASYGTEVVAGVVGAVAVGGSLNAGEILAGGVLGGVSGGIQSSHGGGPDTPPLDLDAGRSHAFNAEAKGPDDTKDFGGDDSGDTSFADTPPQYQESDPGGSPPPYAQHQPNAPSDGPSSSVSDNARTSNTATTNASQTHDGSSARSGDNGQNGGSGSQQASGSENGTRAGSPKETGDGQAGQAAPQHDSVGSQNGQPGSQQSLGDDSNDVTPSHRSDGHHPPTDTQQPSAGSSAPEPTQQSSTENSSSQPTPQQLSSQNESNTSGQHSGGEDANSSPVQHDSHHGQGSGGKAEPTLSQTATPAEAPPTHGDASPPVGQPLGNDIAQDDSRQVDEATHDPSTQASTAASDANGAANQTTPPPTVADAGTPPSPANMTTLQPARANAHTTGPTSVAGTQTATTQASSNPPTSPSTPSANPTERAKPDAPTTRAAAGIAAESNSAPTAVSNVASSPVPTSASHSSMDEKSQLVAGMIPAPPPPPPTSKCPKPKVTAGGRPPTHSNAGGRFEGGVPVWPISASVLGSVVGGVPPRLGRDASLADCVPWANWVVGQLYPDGIRRPVSSDDMVLDRGGISGVQGQVVDAAEWARVGDRKGLLEAVAARPGSTAVVMVSRPRGAIGHVVAVHATTDGLRWVDPQRPDGQQVSSPEDYPRDGMPSEVAHAPDVRAVVIDPQGRVVAPGQWSQIDPTVDALLDADLTREFGAYQAPRPDPPESGSVAGDVSTGAAITPEDASNGFERVEAPNPSITTEALGPGPDEAGPSGTRSSAPGSSIPAVPSNSETFHVRFVNVNDGDIDLDIPNTFREGTYSPTPPAPDPHLPTAQPGFTPTAPSIPVTGLPPGKTVQYRTDTNFVFRDDHRDPLGAAHSPFEFGFLPRDPSNTDLQGFVDGENGAFVSSSRDPNLAFNGPSGHKEVGRRNFRYIIYAPGGIDVNATLGDHRFDYQSEVAFPGGIRRENIVGAQEIIDGTLRSGANTDLPGGQFENLQFGPFVPNRHFDPTAANPPGLDPRFTNNAPDDDSDSPFFDSSSESSQPSTPSPGLRPLRSPPGLPPTSPLPLPPVPAAPPPTPVAPSPLPPVPAAPPPTPVAPSPLPFPPDFATTATSFDFDTPPASPPPTPVAPSPLPFPPDFATTATSFDIDTPPASPPPGQLLPAVAGLMSGVDHGDSDHRARSADDGDIGPRVDKGKSPQHDSVGSQNGQPGSQQSPGDDSNDVTPSHRSDGHHSSTDTQQPFAASSAPEPTQQGSTGSSSNQPTPRSYPASEDAVAGVESPAAPGPLAGLADPGGEARHLIARVWGELSEAGAVDARGLTREGVDDSYVEFFEGWASRFRNEVELRVGFTNFLLTGDPVVGLAGGGRERLDGKGKGRATESDIDDHIAEDSARIGPDELVHRLNRLRERAEEYDVVPHLLSGDETYAREWRVVRAALARSGSDAKLLPAFTTLPDPTDVGAGVGRAVWPVSGLGERLSVSGGGRDRVSAGDSSLSPSHPGLGGEDSGSELTPKAGTPVAPVPPRATPPATLSGLFVGGDEARGFREVRRVGTHGGRLVEDPDGQLWLMKTAKEGDEFLSHLQVAVASLQAAVGLPIPPTRLLDGGRFTIRAWVDATLLDIDISALSGPDLVTLQKHQVFDWLISNHDAHPGQFLRTRDGGIVGIDKDQAFRYFGRDILSWRFHPNGFYGEAEPVYNTMWRGFSQGRGDILLSDPRTGEVGEFITRLREFDDERLRDLLRPYAVGAAKAGKLLSTSGDEPGLTDQRHVENDVESFLSAVIERKSRLVEDFGSLYQRALDARPDPQPAVASGAPRLSPQPSTRPVEDVRANVIEVPTVMVEGTFDTAEPVFSADRPSAQLDSTVALSDITLPQPFLRLHFRTDNHLLFRADTRGPSEIFESGFAPQQPSMRDFEAFILGRSGAFVSTTRNPGLHFRVPFNTRPDVFEYIIDAPGGIEANPTLEDHPYTYQDEVSFPGGIRRENIIGVERVWDTLTGHPGRTVRGTHEYEEFIANPRYDPSAPNTRIARRASADDSDDNADDSDEDSSGALTPRAGSPVAPAPSHPALGGEASSDDDSDEDSSGALTPRAGSPVAPAPSHPALGGEASSADDSDEDSSGALTPRAGSPVAPAPSHPALGGEASSDDDSDEDSSGALTPRAGSPVAPAPSHPALGGEASSDDDSDEDSSGALTPRAGSPVAPAPSHPALGGEASSDDDSDEDSSGALTPRAGSPVAPAPSHPALGGEASSDDDSDEDSSGALTPRAGSPVAPAPPHPALGGEASSDDDSDEDSSGALTPRAGSPVAPAPPHPALSGEDGVAGGESSAAPGPLARLADPGGEARHLIARVWRELPAGVADARGLTREDVDDSYVEFFRRWASRFRNEVELRAGFTSFLLTGDPLVGLEGGARERLDSKGKGRATEADINDHIAEPPDTTRVPLPSIVFGVDDQPSRIPSASEDKTDDPADDLAARQQALGLLAAGDVVGLQFAEDKAAGDGWKATVLDHLVGWGISSPEQAQADLGTMITVLEQARVTINFKAHEWIQEFAGDFERAPESYLNSWERGLRPGGASTKGVLDNVEKSTGGYLRSGRVAGQDADRIAAARIRIQTHLLDPKSDGFVAAGRPRYGAVDYARRTAGGAPAYGTSFFVVKEHVKHRALFVSADSFAAVGGRTTTTYSHIGKLLTHSAEGQLRRLHQYATSSRPGRLTADDGVYFEAQLYTPVRFDRDVAEINVDMAELSSIDDETLSSTIAAMQQFADRYGVKLVIRPWTLEVPFGEGSTSVAEDDDGVTRLVREIVKVAKARNAAGSLGLDVHVEGGGNGSIGGRGAHASGLKRASAVGELIQRKLDVALPADRVSTSFVTVLQPTSRGSALRDGVTGPRAEARRRASVRVEKRPKPAVSTHVLMPFDERSQELSAAQRADLDRFAVALVQRARQVIADGGSGLIVNADGGGNGGRFSRGPVVVGTKRATAALNYLRAQIEKQPGGTPRASDLVTVSDRPTSRGADLKDELAHFDDNQQRRTVLLTVHPRPARRDLQDADGGTGRDLITEQPRAMASLPADAATRSDPADKVALLRDRGDTTPEFDGRSEDSDIYVTDDESEVQARADRGREPSRSADADAVTPAHSGFDAEDSPKESWVSTAADLPPSWRELKEQVAKALREYEAIRAEFPELCDDDSDSNPSALELRDGEAVSLRVSGVGDGKSSPDPGSKQKSYSPASDYSPLLGGHSSAGSGLGERSPSHAADSTSSASLRDAGVVLGGAAGSAWAGSSNGGRSGLPVTDQSEDRSMGSSGNSRSSLSQSASGPGSNVHAGYLHLARKADPVANAGGAQE